ncbi:hypothetical protein CR513_57170, partial [Mucuna pruriens]
MNSYGNLRSKHSSWPFLLVIYNLASWLCMKRKYMMLSMMIFECCETKALMCLIGITIKISRSVSCYFAPSMTFQHTKTCLGTVLRNIKHALYMKKAHLTIN